MAKKILVFRGGWDGHDPVQTSDRVVAGNAFMLNHGHEHWHPAPGFYYQQGGGPLFDMGPYYITALINLLGPVKRVVGMSTRSTDLRFCQARK